MSNTYGIPDDLFNKLSIELKNHPTYKGLCKKYYALLKANDYINAVKYAKKMKEIEKIVINNFIDKMAEVVQPIQNVLALMTQKERDETYSMLYGIVLLLDMLETYCASVTTNIGKYDKATLGSIDDIRKMGDACGNHVRMMLSDNDYEACTFADFADEVTEFFNAKSMDVYRKVQERKRQIAESDKRC